MFKDTADHVKYIKANYPEVTDQRMDDDYAMFRDIEPVLPVADLPTLAYEVIDYIVSVGTVRTVVGGRIVVR